MVNLSRLRRRQHQLTSYLHEKPSRERHYLSIIGSSLSVVLLVVAMSLRQWARAETVNGEGTTLCYFTFGLTKVHVQSVSDSKDYEYSMTNYYKENQQILISCILSVTVLTLISSIVSTFISAGYPREKLEFLRHYSVFNLVALFCIVLVAGLWLAVVMSLPHGRSIPDLNNDCFSSDPTDSNVTTNYGYCYYILLAAGLSSLGATSVNLLQARSAADRRRSRRLRLREQRNREHTVGSVSSRDLTQHSGLLPPPYSTLDSSNDGETTETSMSELEHSDQDEPTSPPPPYSIL